MHDDHRFYPILPGKEMSRQDETMLAPVRGTVWKTCWEYVLTHELTPAEDSAFWHGANLMHKAMSTPEPEPPVLKTPEEKRKFSADWDRRYEEGQASLAERMGHPGGHYG